MSIEPHRSSQMESRWRKPNLYITIVSIYLLVFAVGASVGAAYFFLFGLLSNPLVLISFVTVGIGISIILVVPSVIGARMLLQRKKNGLFFSLGTLTLWSLTLLFMISNMDWFAASATNYATGMSALVLTAAMYALLIIGWKRVQWR